MKNIINDYKESDISLCPLESYHTDFLLKLFIESRPDLYLIQGISEEQKLDIIFQQFNIERQQVMLIYPDANFNIVMLNNEPIGKLYIYHGENAERILEIALLKQYRGLGIGKILMNSVIEKAIKLNKTVNVQVLWFNEAAYRFYEKLGFKVIESKGVALEMQLSKNLIY